MPKTLSLEHELRHSVLLRDLAYRVFVGEHHANDADPFRRRDYIGIGLFSRAMHTHEAIDVVIRKSLADDGWVLTRALIECVVNCAYMILVADDQTADDFVDYPHYTMYQEFLDLKNTNAEFVRDVVSPEDEQQMRRSFERVRNRFDSKRGDRWCADNQLYKRAARVDEVLSQNTGEPYTHFLWLVNHSWRRASRYVHMSADVLSSHVAQTESGASVERRFTPEEGAQVVYTANFAVFSVLLPIDIRLGVGKTTEIRRAMAEWGEIPRELL